MQGTAQRLLLIGVIHLIRQPDKYKLLHRAVMEVHDALRFYFKRKDMWKAIKVGIDILDDGSLKTAREECGINWKVPLKVEPKAGFRFGVQVYKLSDKGPKTTAEFLNAWCKANRESEAEVSNEIGKLS